MGDQAEFAPVALTWDHGFVKREIHAHGITGENTGRDVACINGVTRLEVGFRRKVKTPDRP